MESSWAVIDKLKHIGHLQLCPPLAHLIVCQPDKQVFQAISPDQVRANMKFFRVNLALFFVALAAFATVILLYTNTSRGQSQDPGKPDVKRTLKPIAADNDKRAVDAAKIEHDSSTFGVAASRNSVLRTELNWTFGGKQQHGWYLYTPLINQLLGDEYDTGSDQFASALSRWQKKLGLTPSGVLDEEALFAMVSEWQGRRLKGYSYARPDELLIAPVSDFYDPSRPDELRQVERETYAAYKRMVAAASGDPTLQLIHVAGGELAPAEKYLKIVSSFRSREYQERLRKQSPNAGRAGLATNSPHFTGRALDLYVGGEPVETKDSNRALQVQTPVYQWLVRNAERFGFRPYYYEPWHWEYTGNHQ
jgi:D-alanyl-D-alanine carboxypeptidase